MKIVDATFVNNEVEPGWLILKADTPLGKRYRVDLDSVVKMKMGSWETGRLIDVDCIWVVDPPPPGYLPLLALRIEPEA